MGRFLPWILLALWIGCAAPLAAESSSEGGGASAVFPPEGEWRAVEFWVGGDARDPEARWPGAPFALVGLGEDGGVERLAQCVQTRVAAFDAVTGLDGPLDPLVILWIEDESAARPFGAAAGWIRRLEPDDGARGGRDGRQVWILTGPAAGLEDDLAEAVDRHLVSTRAAGLPGFLQAALLDLLAQARVETGPEGKVRVGLDAAHVDALRGLEGWDSFVGVSLTPWREMPPEARDAVRPQGWAFLHYFLLERSRGRAQLQEALDITRDGALFPAALQEAMIRPPDKLVQKVVRPYAQTRLVRGAPPHEIPVALPAATPFEPPRSRVLRDVARLQELRDRREESRTLRAAASRHLALEPTASEP